MIENEQTHNKQFSKPGLLRKFKHLVPICFSQRTDMVWNPRTWKIFSYSFSKGLFKCLKLNKCYYVGNSNEQLQWNAKRTSRNISASTTFLTYTFLDWTSFIWAMLKAKRHFHIKASNSQPKACDLI